MAVDADKLNAEDISFANRHTVITSEHDHESEDLNAPLLKNESTNEIKSLSSELLSPSNVVDAFWNPWV